MKSFSDFGIATETKALKGDKININSLFDKQIEVTAFKITESKFEGTCIQLELMFGGMQFVCFNGSQNLIRQIQLVPDSLLKLSLKEMENNTPSPNNTLTSVALQVQIRHMQESVNSMHGAMNDPKLAEDKKRQLSRLCNVYSNVVESLQELHRLKIEQFKSDQKILGKVVGSIPVTKLSDDDHGKD